MIDVSKLRRKDQPVLVFTPDRKVKRHSRNLADARAKLAAAEAVSGS